MRPIRHGHSKCARITLNAGAAHNRSRHPKPRDDWTFERTWRGHLLPNDQRRERPFTSSTARFLKRTARASLRSSWRAEGFPREDVHRRLVRRRLMTGAGVSSGSGARRTAIRESSMASVPRHRKSVHRPVDPYVKPGSRVAAVHSFSGDGGLSGDGDRRVQTTIPALLQTNAENRLLIRPRRITILPAMNCSHATSKRSLPPAKTGPRRILEPDPDANGKTDINNNVVSRPISSA